MSVFPSRISLFSGAVALSLLASTATAGTISLAYDGSSVTNQNDWETVTITKIPSYVTPEAELVYAFGFNMTAKTGTLGSFLAWCLDLASPLSTSGEKPYTITDYPFSNSYGLSDAEQARVQSVFDANYAKVNVNHGVEAAGFQVALWNALYDEDWLAGEGIFAASNDSTVIAQADAYLDAAKKYSAGTQRYRMTFLESTPVDGVKYQNLVTVSPVPLPAAGFLLLAALGGLGFAARRRKAV